MAHAAVTGPGAEFHLGDQLRLGPAGVFGVRPGTATGGGSIITPARTRFSSGVPLFGPKPLKFYPTVGFYLSTKSIHDEGRRLGF